MILKPVSSLSSSCHERDTTRLLASGILKLLCRSELYSHCTRVFLDEIIRNIHVSLWPLYILNSHKYNIMCDNFDNVYKDMIPIQPVFEALVRRRKMETSVCTPLMNSCIERFPSWFLSIFIKISFVFSSAERPPFWDSLVILYMAWRVPKINVKLHLNIHLVLKWIKIIII